MTLHDKIMRMPHGTNEAVYSERSDWLAYKTGHRDARHAAAELVAEHAPTQAALLSALESYMAAFGQGLEAYGPQQVEADAQARAVIALARKGDGNG